MINALSFTPPINHVADFGNAFRVGQTLANARPATPQTVTPSSPPSVAEAETQRLQGSRRADVLGALGAGLLSLPYPERSSVLAHMQPVLEREGFPASIIAKFDPTDDALAAATEQAKTIGLQLNPSYTGSP